MKNLNLKINSNLFEKLNLIIRTYTKKNCELECESTLTEQSCGCVQYYMPRTTEETNICSRNNIECYMKIKRL